MPARRAFAPWAIPFHLPRFARWRLPPNGKVSSVAFAIDFFDPTFTILGFGAGQCAIMGDGGCVEIQAAVEFVAMRVGNADGIIDHGGDIIGGNRPMRGLTNVQRLDIGPISFGIMSGDIPDRLGFFRRHFLHLVFACVGVVGQMANIGDVDDMGKLISLVRQHAAQGVGKDISAHIADMRVIIHRRPTRIHPRLARVDRGKGFQLPGQAVEEFKLGHGNGDAGNGCGGQPTSNLSKSP